MTLKRNFDAIITCLLRCVFAGEATLPNMDEYIQIDVYSLRNYNEAKHNRIVCIFLLDKLL